MSEPTSMNRNLAIVGTLVLAMLLGTWAASGQIENLILMAVWFVAVMIIVFVQDYWWSPALVITALTFSTTALGFPLTGMEVGVVILGLTFPVKMAMKTLRKAEPEMSPGMLYWMLLGYVAVHAVVILFYNKIDGAATLKNIVKAYYTVLVPLIFYGLLIRYCHTRTVRPTIVLLFFVSFFAVIASIFTIITGIYVDPFTDLHISVGWLDEGGVFGILRGTGPFLFIGSLAFWPNIRSGVGRCLLGSAIVIGLVGTLLGSGRTSTIICIAAGIFFAVVRGKLWIALPVLIVTGLISAVMTSMPDVAYSLPETVQRSLAPLNFSEQKTEIQGTLEGSDDWHRDLRTRSIDYWMLDTTSFWFGRGFKSWDPSIGNDPNAMITLGYERSLEMAIEMGRTENMFSAMTNIFGATGMVLYALFMGNLARILYKACRIAPAGSDARAICEFSLINLLAALAFCPFTGGPPSIGLIYWLLGILAARPYLAGHKPAPAPAMAEVPAFARPAFAQGSPSGLVPNRFRPGGV
jgi:hypothetical protein